MELELSSLPFLKSLFFLSIISLKIALIVRLTFRSWNCRRIHNWKESSKKTPFLPRHFTKSPCKCRWLLTANISLQICNDSRHNFGYLTTILFSMWNNRPERAHNIENRKKELPWNVFSWRRRLSQHACEACGQKLQKKRTFPHPRGNWWTLIETQ